MSGCPTAVDSAWMRGWRRATRTTRCGTPTSSRNSCSAVYRAGDLDAARVALAEFYDAAQAAGIPECDRLARTIRRWEATTPMTFIMSDARRQGAVR